MRACITHLIRVASVLLCPNWFISFFRSKSNSWSENNRYFSQISHHVRKQNFLVNHPQSIANTESHVELAVCRDLLLISQFNFSIQLFHYLLLDRPCKLEFKIKLWVFMSLHNKTRLSITIPNVIYFNSFCLFRILLCQVCLCPNSFSYTLTTLFYLQDLVPQSICYRTSKKSPDHLFGLLTLYHDLIKQFLLNCHKISNLLFVFF